MSRLPLCEVGLFALNHRECFTHECKYDLIAAEVRRPAFRANGGKRRGGTPAPAYHACSGIFRKNTVLFMGGAKRTGGFSKKHQVLSGCGFAPAPLFQITSGFLRFVALGHHGRFATKRKALT
jgi:hypothetical protein